MSDPSDSHHRGENADLVIDARAPYVALLSPNSETLTAQMEALTRRSGEVQERIRAELFKRLGDPDREPSNRDLVDWIKTESLAQRSYKLNTVSLEGGAKTRTVEDFIKELASRDPE